MTGRIGVVWATPMANSLVRSLNKLNENNTLTLIKETKRRAAEEEAKRANEARLMIELKTMQAKQESELRVARANAKNLREELAAAEAAKFAAIKGVESARAEKEKAERSAEVKLANLPTPSNPTEPPSPSLDGVKAIQNALKQLGCYTGPVDGLWGAGSKSALRSALGAAAAAEPHSQDVLPRLQAAQRGVCKRNKPKTVTSTSKRKATARKKTQSRQSNQRTAKGCRSFATVCGTDYSSYCKHLYREYVAGGCR